MLDKNIKAFVMYMIFLSTMIIHLARKTQIVLLFVKKVKIWAKYANILDIFLKKKASILLKIINLN